MNSSPIEVHFRTGVYFVVMQMGLRANHAICDLLVFRCRLYFDNVASFKIKALFDLCNISYIGLLTL